MKIITDRQIFIIVWQTDTGKIFHNEHGMAKTLLEAVEEGIELVHQFEGEFEILEINPIEGTCQNRDEDAAVEWFRAHGDDLVSSDAAPEFARNNHPDLDEAIDDAVADADSYNHHEAGLMQAGNYL